MVRESKIDWITILLYLAIMLLGWLNLYSTSASEDPSFVNFSTPHGKEAVFMLASFAFGMLILFLDTKFLEITSYVLYGIAILALFGVLAAGLAGASGEVGGAVSWFEIGGIKIQPTEFAKVATLMALSKYVSRFNFTFSNQRDAMISAGIVLLPAALTILQNDAGSALIFFGMILVFWREGMPSWILGGILAVGVVGASSIMFSGYENSKYIILFASVLPFLLVFGVMMVWQRRYLWLLLVPPLVLGSMPFVAEKVVKPHQSARLRVLVADEQEIKEDEALNKVYYNLKHSMIAIASGKLTGKGYGEGIHTRADFVPEEHTDYIHCVIGEEHGFVGSSIMLLLFLLLIYRLWYIAENSKSRYARVMGYGVMAVMGMHVLINVGMTIGVVPTIGIPLPFYSYGGSSVIAFSMMLFVLMNHYSYRHNILN